MPFYLGSTDVNKYILNQGGVVPAIGAPRNLHERSSCDNYLFGK